MASKPRKSTSPLKNAAVQGTGASKARKTSPARSASSPDAATKRRFPGDNAQTQGVKALRYEGEAPTPLAPSPKSKPKAKAKPAPRAKAKPKSKPGPDKGRGYGK